MCWVKDEVPQLRDRGCDNMLPDRGNHTTQEAVIDEYGTMMEWWLEEENQKTLEKNLLQPHFIQYKFCIASPGNEREGPQH
jgi:hypothetical protein